MSTPTLRRDSRSATIIVSAWAVPVLVIGQFAMMAVIPVVLVLVGTLRTTRGRALHWWAGALTLAYATPLAVWAIGPDRAPSLSKDMSPVLAALIVAVAIGVAIAHHRLDKKSAA
ncbi:hypothetical protein [Amycolatopsis sp. H20-H5]|uniref:hypothetical protein n=1 Tax=Amycolatopsis sp. H20-H5 TaxID=3046309 RepID=UPI002DB75430|nr:hypothetical protein [Amycolatopsis sp. H20-H5]MEC3978251.1 hypothetical protein [Amycolatopsis sp. H20-H5]